MELSFGKIRVISNKRNEEHESKASSRRSISPQLCRTVGRLGRKKKKARGAQWEGEREKIPLPIVSRALSMDTQWEPLRWKESYYAFHLGPSSSIFVLEFSYHPHESAQVLVYVLPTATLKTNRPCFLFYSLFYLA